MTNGKLRAMLLCAVVAMGASAQTIEFRGREWSYQIVDGFVVVDGDLIAGRAEMLSNNSKATDQKAAVGYVEAGLAWPKVGGVTQMAVENPTNHADSEEAIRQFNAMFPGVVQIVKRTTETDYITLRPGAQCTSSVGRVSGQQVVTYAGYCGPSGMLHEFAHAFGLLHENQHPDRDQFMRVLFQNATKDPEALAQIAVDPRGFRIGLYDLDSLLAPLVSLPSRNGESTLEMIPPGLDANSSVGTYSEGVKDAIRRLAGSAPKQVTITSLPPGLKLIVDGETITTPKAYNWAVGTNHTLDVPAGVQAVQGLNYGFGRWNDLQPQSHTFTVTAGGGGRTDPADAPAITLVTAMFIPYNEFLLLPSNGSGTGTTRFDPEPLRIPGQTGNFLITNGPNSIVAAPDAGSTFAGWDIGLLSQVGAFLPLSDLTNPYPAARLPGKYSFKPKFTKQPTTTITSDPPGMFVLIDGELRGTPVIFAQEFDPTWGPGTKHTINIRENTQQKNNYKLRRFVFQAWDDGKEQSHEIEAARDGNTVITANFTTQFKVQTTTNGFENCPGKITLDPASPDGFYARGSQVNFTAVPAAGFQLASWGNLTGVTDKQLQQAVTLTEEEAPLVEFNSTDTLLRIAAMTPATLRATGEESTITIDGSGFTAATSAVIWLGGSGSSAQPTFVSPTQLTLKIPATLLQKPGQIKVSLRNFSENRCAVRAEREIAVGPK